MPLVVVNLGKLPKDGNSISDLLSHLPWIVAEELSCDPPGVLRPCEVGVVTRHHDLLDVNEDHLGIIVIANDYPSRRANLDERRSKIVARVVACLSGTGIPGSVWVILVPGSYDTF